MAAEQSGAPNKYCIGRIFMNNSHNNLLFTVFYSDRHASHPEMCFLIQKRHISWPRSGDCDGSRIRTRDCYVLSLLSPSCLKQLSYHIPWLSYHIPYWATTSPTELPHPLLSYHIPCLRVDCSNRLLLIMHRVWAKWTLIMHDRCDKRDRLCAGFTVIEVDDILRCKQHSRIKKVYEMLRYRGLAYAQNNPLYPLVAGRNLWPLR
jgi:hypothetical protein